MLKKSNGSILNYLEKGNQENPALVFLHFFGGSAKTWNTVVDELSSSYYCVAIDFCGWGNSFEPDRKLSVEDNVSQVSEVIERLKLNHYSLVGHSMGGKIALSLAAQKPFGVKSLILIAPSPPTPEPMTDQARGDLKNTFGDRAAIEKLIQKITYSPLEEKLFDEIIEDHLNASYLAWNSWTDLGSRQDITNNLSTVNFPVLVISGSKDPNFSTEFLQNEFTKYFPEARFKEIKNAGHLIPVEAPLEVAQSIRDFLDK